MTARASQRRIVVLAPHAEQTLQPEPRPLAARCSSLDGAQIVFVDNGFVATRVLHDVIRRGLEASGIDAIVERKRYWQPLDPDRIAALAEHADALIGGLGHTPPSSSWGIHDAVAFERLGVPTVSLATSLYEELVTSTARSEGMPDVKRVILPHPLEGVPDLDLESIARRVVDPVIGALTTAGSPAVRHVSMDADDT